MISYDSFQNQDIDIDIGVALTTVSSKKEDIYDLKSTDTGYSSIDNSLTSIGPADMSFENNETRFIEREDCIPISTVNKRAESAVDDCPRDNATVSRENKKLRYRTCPEEYFKGFESVVAEEGIEDIDNVIPEYVVHAIMEQYCKKEHHVDVMEKKEEISEDGCTNKAEISRRGKDYRRSFKKCKQRSRPHTWGFGGEDNLENSYVASEKTNAKKKGKSFLKKMRNSFIGCPSDSEEYPSISEDSITDLITSMMNVPSKTTNEGEEGYIRRASVYSEEQENMMLNEIERRLIEEVNDKKSMPMADLLMLETLLTDATRFDNEYTARAELS